MNRNVYGNIVLTLLLGAVIFFGVMIVNALDRVHAALRDLTAAGIVRTDAVPAVEKTAPAAAESTPVANQEFFDPIAEPGGRLVQAISADTQNLNHLINADAYVAAFHGLANSSLGARNYAKPEEWAPLMAEKWTVSEDCKTYHIYLRKGILWHDLPSIFGRQAFGRSMRSPSATPPRMTITPLCFTPLRCTPVIWTAAISARFGRTRAGAWITE